MGINMEINMWNATSGFIEEKDFDTGLYGNVNGEILIGGEKKTF